MMPEVIVRVDRETSAQLRTLAQMFPRQVYQGMGRAGAAMRGKLRRAMKNSGGEGVPQLASLSMISRQLRDRTIPGGRLVYPEKIQMYKRGRSALTVGFISPVARYAEELQEPETRAYAKHERAYMHRRLGGAIPTQYSRPARPIITPFAVEQNQHFSKWVLGAAVKCIEKHLARKGL